MILPVILAVLAPLAVILGLHFVQSVWWTFALYQVAICLVLPLVASLVRPVARGVVRGGLSLADRVKEIAAEASDQVSDLYAEAKADHYGKAA